MTRRGPKPKPKPMAELRMLQGGRSARPAAAEEILGAVEAPEPPVYLEGFALEEWNRVVADLEATGIFQPVDVATLSMYCVAFGRWRQVEEDLAIAAEKDPINHGATIETTNGNVVQNPLIGVASTWLKNTLRLAAEFGLTPSSRTFLNSGKGQQDDPVARRYGL